MKLIKPNEHVFIAGRTGSGKTFLAENYLAQYENVIALDTKGLIDWDIVPDKEKDIVYNLSDLSYSRKNKIIYKPRWEDLDFFTFNEFFKFCYRRRNTVVWVDEAMSVCPNAHRIPDYYKAILTRGRELGVAVWSLTQRPSGIPALIMSEATHYFIFDLNMKKDREKIIDITGCEEFEERPLQHAFWYKDIRTMKKPTMAKLRK